MILHECARDDSPTFINKDQGILGLTLFQSLDNATWQGANIRSTMTFYLCDISETTDAESVELSIQGSGDGFSDRCFTNTYFRAVSPEQRVGEVNILWP